MQRTTATTRKAIAWTTVALLLGVGLAAAAPAAASHSAPRSDTRDAGTMACGPTAKTGSANDHLIVTINQDNGHLTLTATGNASEAECTFQINILGARCPFGTNPQCSISNVQENLCSAVLGACQTTTELDFSFEFQNPYHTTHLFIDYSLVVYDGLQPLHHNPQTVDTGTVEYWEPGNPFVSGPTEAVSLV